MKDYRGCKYFTLEEVKSGKPNNLGPDKQDAPMSLPTVHIWWYNKDGNFILPVNTGVGIDDVIKKNSEEYLEEISKKTIDIIYNYNEDKKK